MARKRRTAEESIGVVFKSYPAGGDELVIARLHYDQIITDRIRLEDAYRKTVFYVPLFRACGEPPRSTMNTIAGCQHPKNPRQVAGHPHVF